MKKETEALAGAGWQPKGTIEPINERLTAIHLSAMQSVSVKKSQEADWTLWQARALALPKNTEPRFEQSGGFVFVPAITDDPAPTGTTSIMFRFVSGRAATPGEGGTKTVAVERTWFTLYDPLPPKAEPGEPQADAP
ncbi:MAG: hypothetical protein QM783_14230 [Phycisphaerales bacterium]